MDDWIMTIYMCTFKPHEYLREYVTGDVMHCCVSCDKLYRNSLPNSH